ncbi:hypothetical protein J7T55_006267 [Diaporthe amygdali]|uniref:uncharacterized protein n=1 Tax=Phomopsis amygdali TaxID=1214568 RepID=UPI0022FDFEEC|nr:uncharacterized protein J7T55_006267 [Diaporthe amygdali]KAJ0124924.1 hypothetical protein J7T55_006267 [Diaporthe amygdali]
MAISWGTIKSLVIFFGPMLVPKAITWFNSARAAQRNPKQPIRPLPTRTLVAVILLAAAAAVFAISTLPILAPENVFAVTRSNPTSSNNLILSRLAALRALTPRDNVLHDKFESRASKLLYYKYGPDVLLGCPFCNSNEPTTYLLYAAPAVAAAHLLNALLLGAATSAVLTGKAGAQWRSLASYAAVGAAALDAYLLASWDHVAGNEKARVLGEVTFFYWRARALRYLGLAALDLLVAGALYLSGTHRMFPVAQTVSERVDAVTAGLAKTRNQLHAAGVIKNTTTRDGELRAAEARYWAHEVIIMSEAMESEEVVGSMKDAVENRRIDLDNIGQVADTYARDVLQQAMA